MAHISNAAPVVVDVEEHLQLLVDRKGNAVGHVSIEGENASCILG